MLIEDMSKIAPLFEGWNETLIWSCLQGCMGYAIADDASNPKSAQIVVADFCFFAGVSNEALVEKAGAFIIVPQNEAWEKTIEKVWGDRVKKTTRYAIKKEPDVFDREKLTLYTHSLGDKYEIKLIDEKIYNMAMSNKWSRDLCSQFADYHDFENRGLGVVALYKGELVAGASSYTIYNGGIEIEIDTMEEYREKGLATICGARLILECLDRGIYPSWDAFDMRSVHLAEKLGYHMDYPYTVYMKV